MDDACILHASFQHACVLEVFFIRWVEDGWMEDGWMYWLSWYAIWTKGKRTIAAVVPTTPSELGDRLILVQRLIQF